MTATMDFFAHQHRAETSSRRLVVLFVLAVVGIIGLTYLAFAASFQVSDLHTSWWQPGLLLAVSAGTLAVVGLASAFKIAQLASGGPAVARMLGGREVAANTDDLRERTLRNVVEEMAIASGVPVPHVFVLDTETGINAFAAGFTTKDAAVTVTRGAIEQLDRDELQGVIAHEFSHMFHGDMRLNVRLMGWLFGILVIALTGQMIVRSIGRGSGGGRGKGGAAGIIFFGFALIAIGYLGVFFGRLIQAAVSRQREFLADASAVQYTRNPRGIGLALAHIGGIGAIVHNDHAAEASHMFFADGVQNFLGGLNTHPPLEERIERVLPGFLRQRGQTMWDRAAAVVPPPSAEPAPLAGFAAGTVASAERIVQSVGAPHEGHVRAARELLSSLPLDVLAAARDPQRVPALCCALLLDADAAVRAAQVQILERQDKALAYEATALSGETGKLDRAGRLPLLEVAAPALRKVALTTAQNLRSTTRALAGADQQLSSFELALLALVERHLPGNLETPAPRRQLSDMPADVERLLSTLSHAASPGVAAAAEQAFAAATSVLDQLPAMTLRPPESGMQPLLQTALRRLCNTTPLGKRQLLLACARAVGADGVLQPEEAELLRAIAENLGCPMPPVFGPDGTVVTAP